METNQRKIDFIGEVVRIIEEKSIIRIYDKFFNGLYRLTYYSHIIILYWFHERDDAKNRSVLRVTPKKHKGAPEIGVFASRSPSRPNPLGLTVVELLSIRGCKLIVRGLDAKNRTPIVDIKPYIPISDLVSKFKIPEYMNISPEN